MTAPHRFPEPVGFIETFCTATDGSPLVPVGHQQRFIRRFASVDAHGLLHAPYSTVVYSCPKKSGKSAINAALTLWAAVSFPAPNEIIVAANDFEQAQGRVFKEVLRMLHAHPTLEAQIRRETRSEIELVNGTTIKAIASDYAGAAGSNHGWASFDELWAFTSESARRLYDELTPVPTRHPSIRFISTYAGFEGESDLLEEIYKRCVNGERLDPEYPFYRDGDTLMYWDHEPRMPWQTPDYYASQRASLRPSAYLRLHENRWVSGESGLFEMEEWDACERDSYSPPISDKGITLYVGADASTKRDRSAVTSVFYGDDDKLYLGPRRYWQPSTTDPLDLEATMEAFILELSERFTLAAVLYDPYQFHRSAQTLTRAGVPMQEFPQTVGNTVDMSQALFDLVKHRNIVLYPDNDLRLEAARAMGKETPRGVRIVKEKASHKIDSIVALAMAALEAVRMGKPIPFEMGEAFGEMEAESLNRQLGGIGDIGSFAEIDDLW